MTEQEKRENTIKGLECCVNDLGECEVCPYDEGMGKLACGKNLYSDALALLKAQEPRAIKNSAGNGICPGCGRIIPAWSSPNYCGYCGRPVKWE